MIAPAHPRSRGENRRQQTLSPSSDGSSPLTRGKHEEGRRGGPQTGLIPAHAGKTLGGLPGGGACRAHPRSRGENWLIPARLSPAQGSSPLTRGKPRSTTSGTTESGLIPAHAGKTSTYSHTRAHPRAHPRSRGENFKMASAVRLFGGSSPLTRGKLRPRPGRQDVRGLIPAHAGKTARRHRWP